MINFKVQYCNTLQLGLLLVANYLTHQFEIPKLSINLFLLFLSGVSVYHPILMESEIAMNPFFFKSMKITLLFYITDIYVKQLCHCHCFLS